MQKLPEYRLFIAVNKMDLEGADMEKIKKQMSGHEIVLKIGEGM